MTEVISWTEYDIDSTTYAQSRHLCTVPCIIGMLFIFKFISFWLNYFFVCWETGEEEDFKVIYLICCIISLCITIHFNCSSIPGEDLEQGKEKQNRLNQNYQNNNSSSRKSQSEISILS